MFSWRMLCEGNVSYAVWRSHDSVAQREVMRQCDVTLLHPVTLRHHLTSHALEYVARSCGRTDFWNWGLPFWSPRCFKNDMFVIILLWLLCGTELRVNTAISFCMSAHVLGFKRSAWYLNSRVFKNISFLISLFWRCIRAVSDSPLFVYRPQIDWLENLDNHLKIIWTLRKLTLFVVAYIDARHYPSRWFHLLFGRI